MLHFLFTQRVCLNIIKTNIY